MHRFSLLPSVVAFALGPALLPSPTAAQTGSFPTISQRQFTGGSAKVTVAGTQAELTQKAGARVATMGGNFVGDPGVQVALVLSGDVGQFAGQCGPLGGTDSLTGTLVREGSGPVAPDEDVMYRGLLARKTHISACGTKPAPTEDQVAMCSATLMGSAQMNVELEVNEGDRGAWIKMKADPNSPITKSISGCPEPGDWLKDYYPDGASGLGIETVPSGLLRVGTYTEPGISLEVIRE
jgi:hypothetical protein